MRLLIGCLAPVGSDWLLGSEKFPNLEVTAIVLPVTSDPLLLIQMSKTLKYRRWVFTYFGFRTKDEPLAWPSVKYCKWQLEECPQTKRPHLQGAVWFKSQRALLGLKKLGTEIHWEPMRSQSGSMEYVGKEKTRLEGPWEVGQLPAQGKRSDLVEIKAALDAGCSVASLADSYFGSWVRYRRSFSAYKLLKNSNYMRGRPEILVVYGPSGVGKTVCVREAVGRLGYWLEKPPSNSPLWFDGYEEQKIVVVDEFFGWIPYNQLKRLLDYGCTKVKVHGGMVPMVADKWIFTSNVHPRYWYKNIKDPSRALERRLCEFADLLFIDCTKKWTWESWEGFFQTPRSKEYDVRFRPY